MLARILFCFIACMPFVTKGQADIVSVLRSAWGQHTPPPPPTIKVLVLHDQDGAILEIKGKYKIQDPHANEHISTRLVGKSQFIQAIPSGLKWGEEFPGIHQLEMIPTTPETDIIVNGNRYPGSVTIYNIGGTISIVNELTIEEYLANLLAEKYSQSLSEEALAALVISERTNAYFMAQHPKSNYFAVDGTQNGYKGIVSKEANSPVQRAIRNTRYMVMSRTGLYEGVVTPFAVQWEPPSKTTKAELSHLSVAQADDLAKHGEHAAAILEKAFPHTTIQLIRFTER